MVVKQDPTTRIPPHSVEAEMSLLGALILSGESADVAECSAMIPDQNAFWVPAHVAIYAALLSLAAGNHPIGAGTLLTACQASTEFVKIGGADYLLKLCEGTPGAATWRYFAGQVRDLYRRRMLAVCGESLADAAHDPGAKTVDDIAANAADRISRALECGKRINIVSIREACESTLAELRAGTPSFFATGLVGFDGAFGGLPKGAVTTVMGTPSSGKTTLVMQIMLHRALCGDRVMVFSNEQNASRIAATMLTMTSRVQVHAMLSAGEASTEQMDRIEQASADISDLPIELVEESMHAGQIYTHAKLAASRGVQIVVVDYIQDLPPVPGYPNGEERVSESVRNLKRIARELGMAMVMVSQIDKTTSKEGRRPTMFDGLYSSRIEQASDFMVGVFRPNMHEPPPSVDDQFALDAWRQSVNQTEAILLKNKYGPRGAVMLRFDPSCMTFAE